MYVPNAELNNRLVKFTQVGMYLLTLSKQITNYLTNRGA
jgi:hypothetical protein